MVELPGSLERSTLGDVLGVLHRDRVTGTLWLNEVSGGREHRHVIVWRDGLIHHVETTRRRALTSDPAHRRAAERWTSDDPQRVELLERLEALFQLTHAKLSFRVMGPRPPRARAPLEPSEFLHGRRRSRDTGPRTPMPPLVEPEATHARPPRTPSPAPVVQESARARALRTLGLAGDPGTDAVRAAFRQLAWRWHPDRHPGASDGARAVLCRRFAQITGAYEQLIGQR
jgi:hypothetical protein